MKLLVFGSTGSVGRHIVRLGLERGHAVTAFTRDAGKIDLYHERLRLAVGNVLEPRSIKKAMPGQNAVLVALGAGRRGTVRAEGTRNIIVAMKEAGVARLICQSTLGVGDSWENLNAFWKYAMFKFLLRSAFADHVRQEAYVRGSDLAWTIVRPGAFTGGELTGRYRHGFLATDRTTRLKISQADVADFMLKQLDDETYLGRTPGLSY